MPYVEQLKYFVCDKTGLINFNDIFDFSDVQKVTPVSHTIFCDLLRKHKF